MLIIIGQKDKKYNLLEIQCSKCNRIFSRRKSLFKEDQQCPYCEGNAVYDVEHFKQKIVEQYGNDFYDLSPIKSYDGYSGKATVRCLRCSAIEEKSNSSLLNGRSGCTKCHRKRIWENRKDDLYESFKVNYKSDYFTITDYDIETKMVRFECNHCGYTHEDQPNMSLVRTTCPQCYTQRKTTEQFIEEATKKFGKRYAYHCSTYTTAKTPIEIFCNSCNKSFMTIPNNFLSNCGGCSRCSAKFSWSSISIECIDTIIEKTGIHFVHAVNGQEKRIKIADTWCFADGYNDELKIVIEFHGDMYHGNPKIYSDDEHCSPMSDLTAKELYEKTLLKEQRLKDSGYTVITIWENDYRNNREATVNDAATVINSLKRSKGI